MAELQAELVMTMTPLAVDRVRSLMQEKGLADYGLRVFVAGGGCSGMQYGMAFEGNPQASDLIMEFEGVKLIVDPVSRGYLEGASIDFVDNLMGGGFRIENPNAVSSCGCGHSFRTKEGGEAEASAGGCGSCASH